jgi:sugar lactone lactonase YvrE
MNVLPEILIDGLLFPESPRWHGGALWFSDMYAGRVYRFTPVTPESGHLKLVAEVPGRPSGLGWLPNGEMLVVSMADRRILRLGPGGMGVHAELADLVAGDANDMVVDANGRAYVGNFGYGYAEGVEVEPTGIAIVEPGGQARIGADGFLFPNGSVISADGRRLIVAEGFRQALTEFTVGETGGLSERRQFADLRGEIPDGIALDADDCVWVALPLRQEFIRVERGGNVIGRISVAPRSAFACALGGPERRTLFMCATLGGPEQIRAGRSQGAVMVADVDCPGVGWP